MSVTEKFHFTGKIRGKHSTSTSRRTVEITGKDLPKFADVLIAQAKAARAAKNISHAEYLERVAATVRKAKKFTMAVPLDAKLGAD
jgi:hypothetical protein